RPTPCRGSPHRRSFMAASLLFHDPEDIKAVAPVLRSELVAGLVDEVGDVDDSERVRAFEHQNAADWNCAQRLLGPQHGLRTVQSAQIESRLFRLPSGGGRSGQHSITRPTRPLRLTTARAGSGKIIRACLRQEIAWAGRASRRRSPLAAAA